VTLGKEYINMLHNYAITLLLVGKTEYPPLVSLGIWHNIT